VFEAVEELANELAGQAAPSGFVVVARGAALVAVSAAPGETDSAAHQRGCVVEPIVAAVLAPARSSPSSAWVSASIPACPRPRCLPVSLQGNRTDTLLCVRLPQVLPPGTADVQVTTADGRTRRRHVNTSYGDALAILLKGSVRARLRSTR
jgi:hypothetical protein